jgi:hypothetical protein
LFAGISRRAAFREENADRPVPGLDVFAYMRIRAPGPRAFLKEQDQELHAIG